MQTIITSMEVVLVYIYKVRINDLVPWHIRLAIIFLNISNTDIGEHFAKSHTKGYMLFNFASVECSIIEGLVLQHRVW